MTDTAVIEARIRASFDKQGLMGTLGATLITVGRGLVEIALTPSDAVSQQHGFVHAGAVGALPTALPVTPRSPSCRPMPAF